MSERHSNGSRPSGGTNSRSNERKVAVSSTCNFLPTCTPVDGINFPLGGHPDSVLFSNYVMGLFGGIDEVRKDFGGYLMMYGNFIEQYLPQAQAISFDDGPDTVPPIDWTARPVAAMLHDGSLTSNEIAKRLGCWPSMVRDARRRAGIRARSFTHAATCESCGATITVVSSNKNPRRFCGDTCRSRHRRAFLRGA